MSSLKLRMKQSGFTLIELLIVIIIVAILAAVGLSLLRGNTDAARLSEGVAGLGTIRTAMRTQLTENNAYPTGTGFAAGNNIQDSGIGFNAGDLCGRFFSDSDYVWGTTTTATTFCARVRGSAADGVCPDAAPKGGAVPITVFRSMNESGDIFNSLDCSGIRVN